MLQDSGATYTPGISERRGGASKYQHGDLTGSSRALSDSSQAVSDSWVYDGFGMVANRTGTTATPFGYGGGVQYQSDAQSGLMLLGNRYYDSSVGRFISRDPAKSGSNWFAYCGNNPLNRSDPSGLAYICDDGDLAAHGKGIAMPFNDGKDWLDNTANTAAGFGDPFSTIPGFTGGMRWALGANSKVDSNDAYYKGGNAAALALVALVAYATLAGELAGGGQCFVAGTAVQMADGTSKPIEQVKAGDWVDSRDAEKVEKSKDKLKSSENVGKRVVRSFVTEKKSTVKVALTNGETIQCTTGHLFFVEGKGFTPAARLALGNAIVTRAGPSVKVKKVEQSGTATVYNFEVEETHTYFVGKTQAWVHNAGLCDDIVAKIRDSGVFDHTVGSKEEAHDLLQKAFPDGESVPDAHLGQPYPNPNDPKGPWYQKHPPEPGTHDLPHYKYGDWRRGKKKTGGSWGHIFFPDE